MTAALWKLEEVGEGEGMLLEKGIRGKLIGVEAVVAAAVFDQSERR